MSTVNREVAQIAINKVKDYLNTLANADVNQALKAINAELKPYKADLKALVDGKAPVFIETEAGRVRKVDIVPVLDEHTGLQKTVLKRTDKKDASSAKETLVTKEVPVSKTLSEAELEDIKKRTTAFAAKAEILAKKSSAYKTHKVKFQKRALKVLIEFIQGVCQKYLEAALYMSKKWAMDNGSAKVKISLNHMMTCDFLAVPGIKAFMGREFFAIQRQAFEDELNSTKVTAAKEEKKRLKGLGFTKSTAARKKDAEKRRKEAEIAIEEDKLKFKDMSCEKYLEIKSRELYKKSTKSTEKKDKKIKEKSDILFASAIKAQFKAANDNAYTVSHDVIVFLDKCIREFLGHVAGYATALFATGKTFNDTHAAVFVSGYISSDIKVSKALEIREIMVTSEAALENQREENAKLKEKGLLPPKIDMDSLPKEQGFEVTATVNMDGQFGHCYNCIREKVTEFRKADKQKSDEQKERTKLKKSGVLSKEVFPKKTTQEDSDSDSSDSDDEPVQQVKTKKVKKSVK